MLSSKNFFALMSAAPGDGCVGASILPREAAGTFSCLLARVFLHEVSVSGQQQPSNVQFPGART